MNMTVEMIKQNEEVYEEIRKEILESGRRNYFKESCSWCKDVKGREESNRNLSQSINGRRTDCIYGVCKERMVI